MTSLEPKNLDSNGQLEQWIDGFWQWSCHIYQNQEVAKICIAVQDTLHLNVNFMLLALWAEQEQIEINHEQWHQIEQDSESALDAVNYIREKRVALKGKSEEAYQQALLIELKAEQQHQKQSIQSLYKQYQSLKKVGGWQNNLQNYLEFKQISSEDQATVQQLGQLVQNISL